MDQNLDTARLLPRMRHRTRGATILRLCPVAGCPNLVPHGRCHTHRIPDRGHRHRQVRAQVLAEESTCWICGEPGTRADPLTLDHVIPLAAGGPTSRANSRAAHRSCNSRRGAKMRGGGGQ